MVAYVRKYFAKIIIDLPQNNSHIFIYIVVDVLLRILPTLLLCIMFHYYGVLLSILRARFI